MDLLLVLFILIEDSKEEYYQYDNSWFEKLFEQSEQQFHEMFRMKKVNFYRY